MKFSSQAASAYALIAKKGALVTFTRTATTDFDPVTEEATTATSTFSMPGLGLPPGKSAEFRLGSLERRNLIEVHLAPSGGTVPQAGDTFVWAGYTYTVIWANELNPAGDGAPYALAYGER